MNDTTVGQIIKSKRKKIGISTQDLEQKLKLKAGYISKIESDETFWGWVPTQDDLIKIADALWLDSDTLIISSGMIPKRIIDILENNTPCMVLLKAYIEQFESRYAPMDNKSKKGAK